MAHILLKSCNSEHPFYSIMVYVIYEADKTFTSWSKSESLREFGSCTTQLCILIVSMDYTYERKPKKNRTMAKH